MKHYRAQTSKAVAAMGFTDLYVLDYTDLSAAAADNTAVAVTLETLAVGDKVSQDALVEVVTAWAGPADLTGTVSVGVTGTATAITPALTICTGGTGAAAKVGNVSACQTNADYLVQTSAIALIATFTPDADSGVDEFTAGKLYVWANISRYSERTAIQV